MCSSKRFHAVDLQDLFSALARRRGALWIDRDEAGARSFMAFAPVAQLMIGSEDLARGSDPLDAIAAFVAAAEPLEDAPGQLVPHVAGVLAYDLGLTIEPRALASMGIDPRTPAVLLQRYDAVAVVTPSGFGDGTGQRVRPRGEVLGQAVGDTDRLTADAAAQRPPGDGSGPVRGDVAEPSSATGTGAGSATTPARAPHPPSSVDLCVVARRPEDLLAWDELLAEVSRARAGAPPAESRRDAAVDARPRRSRERAGAPSAESRRDGPAALPNPPGRPGEEPDRARHAAAVERALEFIAAGDVYELNLASHFQTRSTLSPADLYWRLRQAQRVPFGVFLPWEPVTLLCRSPERFLAVAGATILTQPIKGTRPRATAAAADRALADELLASVKERAEHVLVVDLERNDLGRVCGPGSVRVSSLARLEEFRTVRHLVSTVEGRLRDEIGLRDILRATFPGGSITGAPKIRAMQLIAALEPRPRGLYTGCVIWFSSPRHFDSCIMIRSALALPPDPGAADRGRLWEYAVGGGIVADSDPAQEVLELWWKAGPFLSATGPDVAALPARPPASADTAG